MINLKNIKNIIFDLGNILLDVDENKTIDAFKRVGVKQFDEKFNKIIKSDILYNFEKGKYSPKKFRALMNDILAINLSDNEFDNCWNKMLLDFPDKRIDLLKELSKNFNLYLLSNTNQIHTDYFTSQKYWPNKVFTKEYFSQDTGSRKPELEIYQYIINDAKIIPRESIFIDDRIENIEAAKKLTINGYHLHKNDEICEIF